MKFQRIIFMVMLIFALQLVSANELNNGVLKLSLVNQQPDPVGPGEYVDVRFKVENIGDESLENIEVEVLPTYPFTLDPGDEKIKEISSLNSFQKEVQGQIIKYKLRVDNKAVKGQNPISVRIKSEGKDWVTYEFDLSVQTIDANLDIVSFKTDPSPARPGENTTITIDVKNEADSFIKDIKFKLDLTLESFGTKQLDSLPFAPINSGTEKKINMLSAGEEKQISYDLRVYPTASSRVYQVPLIIEYYDELNNKYQKNELIGIIVNSAPELSIILDEEGAGHMPGTTDEISIRFTNKGLTDIKFLTVTLKPTNEFESVSSKEVYLGNIDSDDYEIADYSIYINPTDKEKINLPISFEYMDANNNKHEDTKELELKILTKSEQEKFAKQSGGSSVFIFLIVIAAIVIGGYLFYRKRKQN